MNAEELFRKVKKDLIELYPEQEARQLAFILLEDKYGIDKMKVLKQSVIKGIDFSDLELTIKALQQHVPIQHITQKVTFCGLDFKADARALIPRPETEEMVMHIVNQITKSHLKEFKFLDIGTGTGCIAITIAKNFPDATIYALDVSREAISLAKENSAIHQVNINWIQGDVLKPDTLGLIKGVHYLVSNPPYITLSEQTEMRKNVLNWEPYQALFVSDDEPLLFYKSILALKEKLLSSKAQVFFEINERYGEKLIELLVTNQFKNIILTKDFRGKDRVLSGIYYPNLVSN